MTRKIDATGPLYAVVGAGDLAVERVRTYAHDVQARFSSVELEPKALRDQARTVVGARVDEAVAELNDTYGDLAARGKGLVSRIRGQQATRDAESAVGTTVAKARTTRTQTARSAKASASTTGRAAGSTGATAKRNVTATGTSARKAATASGRAATDAAKKVGS